MGKPSREFFASTMWEDVDTEAICMIGDDIVADINGARDAGVGTTILVQTGKYRRGDESKLNTMAAAGSGRDGGSKTITSHSDFQVCPSIVEAVEYILSQS